MAKKTPEQKKSEAAAKIVAAKQAEHVASLEAAPVQTTRNVVFVAVKLPHGLTLRAFKTIEVNKSEQGRMVLEKVAQQVGEAFTVKGNAAPHGQTPRAPIVGGFAITAGCPLDLWKKWRKDNENSDMVKNGLIIAHEKRDSLEAMCRENKKQRSGLERIDVSKDSKDPRVLKQVRKFDEKDFGDDEDGNVAAA
jgi:hypothetical protein